MALASTINVRPVGAFNYQVLLHDLSIAGCRVELVEEAEIGEAVDRPLSAARAPGRRHPLEGRLDRGRRILRGGCIRPCSTRW